MKLRRKINKNRIRREKRVRAKAKGTASRPRFSVFRSHRGIYAQLIDDMNAKTLVSASSKEIKNKAKKTDLAKKVGELIALKAKKLDIKSAVFDRGAYRYHGRVKALAEGAKEGGLKI